MCKHSPRSPKGSTIPTWLTSAEQLLVKHCTKANKYLSLVEEVNLLEVNPDYSILGLKDIREASVSNRHLPSIEDQGEIFQDPVEIDQVHEISETPFV